ncbi:MAG: tyrosine--tRNA ligase [Actinomycetota bacterium]|jgi:tyrosyl-tRNA synthetase|nr:tyrosine--tRNA ligase [Actinomycetota bacterium]
MLKRPGAAGRRGTLGVVTLFDDLSWRGLVHQVTDDALPDLLSRERFTAYVGFDPTADSLHVGNLQQICTLRRLQLAGHRPIALVGGGTGMVGDPSGKSDERVLLTPDVLAANREGIRVQLERFLDFSEGGAVLADNYEWLGSAGLLEFLRDVGKHFSVNEMVRKDSVRSRLQGREHGLSFTEFSYMLLQSWDFVVLHDRYGCRLQLGGSDQWGNITEGVDLLRRVRSAHGFGLTSPLVTKADGSKFGKSEAATVWLDARRTSPYAFFQFWLNTADAEVGSYLRRFTFQDSDTIEVLEGVTARQPERREAQRVLARELTTLVHGADESARAEAAAAALFTPDIAALDASVLEAALADAPQSPAGLPVTLTEAFVAAGLVGSKSAARRALGEHALYVNNRRETDDRSLSAADALHGRWIVLRHGRRNQHVMVVTP